MAIINRPQYYLCAECESPLTRRRSTRVWPHSSPAGQRKLNCDGGARDHFDFQEANLKCA